MKGSNFFQQFGAGATKHPYYPVNLRLDGYTPLIHEFDYILGIFFASVASVALLTWFYSGRIKQLSTLERVLSCWFAITGVIHFVIEGKALKA
jgi:cholestenol Delta-isomerase